jgi:hypothetical protein
MTARYLVDGHAYVVGGAAIDGLGVVNGLCSWSVVVVVDVATMSASLPVVNRR